MFYSCLQSNPESRAFCFSLKFKKSFIDFVIVSAPFSVCPRQHVKNLPHASRAGQVKNVKNFTFRKRSIFTAVYRFNLFKFDFNLKTFYSAGPAIIYRRYKNAETT